MSLSKWLPTVVSWLKKDFQVKGIFNFYEKNIITIRVFGDNKGILCCKLLIPGALHESG
jgi:hypothetical protein